MMNCKSGSTQINIKNSHENKICNESHNSCALKSELSPSIFKLTVDCFHKIFDWLSLTDLISVGHTCKKLQQTAGNFFQLNYAFKIARENDGIQIASQPSNIFCQYIQKISISGDRLSAYQFVGANCTSSIRHFRVYGVLPDGGFKYVKEILKDIEFLEMNECVMNDEFYENCLKYCSNVRTISVTRSDRIRDKSIIIGTGNEWLLRKYLKLKHFELTDSYGLKNNELKEFFEQNSNIQTFSTDSRTFWENRQSIFDANVNFDKLAVDIYQTKILNSNGEHISMVDCCYDMLIQLYKKKFFKHLHLYMVCIDQKNIDKLCTLYGIEMIIGNIVQIDNPLLDTNAINFWRGDDISNVEHLSQFLPNLERICFTSITCDSILRFIRHWPKLKEIRLRRLNEGIQYKGLDVIALNRERENLVNARKVTIYVKEDTYLATKWSSKAIDLNLIKIKRFDSAEWEELSARAQYYKLL